MKRHLLHFVVLAAVLLTSCHTGHKYVSSRSRQPKFLDDIYMDEHSKNTVAADAIDRNVKPADKKYTTRKKYTPKAGADVEPRAADNGAPKACVSKGDAKELREKYAGMLGVNKKEITNFDLYSFIDEWYGTTYHMGGQDRSGIDCSGFAMKLYEKVFGTDLPHSSREQYATCRHIKKGDDYEEGDLLFFKTKGSRISHVGVYLRNDYFVHASTTQGVVINNLKEEYYQRHFAGAGKAHKG